MKYKKNKLRLNEIQSFYFLFKFGLVLIYILKVYRKRSSSILLRKNMFNYLHFFWKAYTFLSFERFLCWKFRNYSQHVFSKFSADIYLELLIIGGSIFTLYLASAAFSLVCVGSIFFSFFFFFFFYQYFPWRILKIQRDSREPRGSYYFSFPLPLAHEYSFSSSRFSPVRFNWSICNCPTDSWWDLFSRVLFVFSLMQLSRSYWLSQFKVTLWGFELISNYHPSITKRMA